MFSLSQPIRCTRRDGFTLLELLLVLAVMAALGAIAWPSLTGRLELQRLQRNADEMRSQWISARVSAMQQQSVYAFRYAISGDQWQLGPWDAAAGGMVGSNASRPTATNEVDALETPEATIEATLRDDCKFYGGTKTSTARELWHEPEAGRGSLTVQWSSPILFYSDGTTSTATVYLTGRSDEDAIRLDLRGLTGTTTVSDIAPLEELEQ